MTWHWHLAHLAGVTGIQTPAGRRCHSWSLDFLILCILYIHAMPNSFWKGYRGFTGWQMNPPEIRPVL
jgi:hypothetical protein